MELIKTFVIYKLLQNSLFLIARDLDLSYSTAELVSRSIPSWLLFRTSFKNECQMTFAYYKIFIYLCYDLYVRLACIFSEFIL